MSLAGSILVWCTDLIRFWNVDSEGFFHGERGYQYGVV